MKEILMKPLARATLFSFAIHLGVFFLLTKFELPQHEPHPIIVEIQFEPLIKTAKKNALHSSKGSSTASGFASKKVNIGLQNSAKSLLNRYERIQENTLEPNPHELESALNPNAAFSSSELRTHQDIWSLIDQNIVSSQFLGEYNHTGSVKIIFRLKTNGTLDAESIKGCSLNSVLKVYATRSIRKTFETEREGSFPVKNIVANFNWTPDCNPEVRVSNQQLHFCRRTKALQQTFSGAEQTISYLTALAYGPGAIEEIEKYNRQKSRRNTKFDPFSILEQDPDWDLACN